MIVLIILIIGTKTNAKESEQTKGMAFLCIFWDNFNLVFFGFLFFWNA